MASVDSVEMSWSKTELAPIFGPLTGRRAWHRLEERVSKLNKDGARYGVRLKASFEDGELALAARNLESLERFRTKLGAARGRVQSAFARLIGERAADGGPKAMGECLERQRGEVVRLAREPLRLFSDMATLSGSVFIDPPFRYEGAAAKAKTAVDSILAEVSSPALGSLLIVGPSGIGKSTLAGEAFRRLRAAPGAGWSHPLFVPASALLLDASGSPDWERLPGVPAGVGSRLESLFKEGKLLLFLDGLDENLRLMDLSNPAAWSFWGMASRNRCVITCRDRFYQYRFSYSPVERIFGGGLRVLNLPYWGPEQAKALYAAISARGAGAPKARRMVEGLEHLGRLPPDTLRDKMASFQITGMTAWNFAIYFALHNGGKFPRSEFEILDYFVDQALRWEKGKASEAEPMSSEILRGLLVRLGRSADGERNGRKSWRITPDAILEVVGRYYPFLLERKNDLFAALRRIPFLEYEADTGAFHLDYRLGCYFTAKNIVMMALQGDHERLREECQARMSFQTFAFLLQAFDAFDDDARKRFYEMGRRVFEDSFALYSREASTQHLCSMYEILEPLGSLRWPAAGAFLARLTERPTDYPELINLVAARAVAYAGNQEAVDTYLRRLRREPTARQINRNYYLHWLWLGDEYPMDDDRDHAKNLVPGEWDRICQWFSTRLVTDQYKPLRHIQLFTFTDFLQMLGRGSLEHGTLRAVALKLQRESSGWSALAREDLARFKKLVDKLDPA